MSSATRGRILKVMSYQYLFCASCGTRRTGHGYQCSVCGGLLRHDTPRVRNDVRSVQPLKVFWQAPAPQPTGQPERERVTA